ncbi:MAG TPA: hypothetical protein VMT00_05715 [Thermoanaerobaculia bacterium]|nr:hypothetical protein [Thermoanaerobaculia bacterium]
MPVVSQRELDPPAPMRSSVPLLLPVLLGLALHLPALGGWWLTDDPQVLVHAIRHSPREILFDPEAYRYLSSSSFTPLVTLSFDLDHAIAGVRPWFFYLHQVIVALVAAVLLFRLLVRWLTPRLAMLTAIAFIASPMTTFAVRSLMLRHYVEGLVLALAALLVWGKGERSARSAPWDITAAGLYLVAMLAKEFYAPLPLLMIAFALTSGQNLVRTARRLLFPAAAAIVYLLWRWWMLGSGGGYGGDWPEAGSLAHLASRVGRAVIGAGVDPDATALATRLGLLAALVAAAATAILLLRAFARTALHAFGFAVPSVVFLILPLLFLTEDFDRRYAFVASALLVTSAGLAASVWPAGHLRELLLALVAMALAAGGIIEHAAFRIRTLQMVAEGQYVWRKHDSAPVLLAWSPGWYLEGLAELRSRDAGTEAPRFLLSTVPLALREIPSRAVWTSNPKSAAVTPLPEDLVASIQEESRRFEPDAPLAFRFRRRRNDLSWEVAPAGDRFTFLTYPRYDDFPLPGSGWRRLPRPDGPQRFRVRRDSLDGRWTISPPLELPSDGEELRWERTRDR